MSIKLKMWPLESRQGKKLMPQVARYTPDDRHSTITIAQADHYLIGILKLS